MLALATGVLRSSGDDEHDGDEWVSDQFSPSTTELTARIENFHALVRGSALRGLSPEERTVLARLAERVWALLSG